MFACLAVGCGPRIVVDDDGSLDGSTGKDADTSVATTQVDPTTAGSGSAGPTTANPTTDPTDPTDPSHGDDDGDPGCTPFDECMTNDDCLPGQACLFSCVCFGQPTPACDEAGSCDACADCELDMGGACEAQMQACQANPQCAALMACLFECDGDQMCAQVCLGDHPAGQSGFFDIAECVIAACPSSCS